MTPPDEKKEKVIHTRISETLDDEIRKKATRLGLSVSNLVRNTLLNTFGLVEDLVADSANIAKSARGEEADQDGAPPGTPDAPGWKGGASRVVLGWQEAILNVNAVCDACNALLKKGTPAGIAVTERPGPRTIICKDCLAAVAAPEE